MRPDQMAGRERAAETQLAGQHARRDDASELPSVVARRGGVRAADTEEVEAGGLGLKDGAAADGADFDARHRDGDLEVAFEAVFGISGRKGVGEGDRKGRKGVLTCASR